MATKLIKAVVRETVSTDRRGRPLIVTLAPGILMFRAKGTRRTMTVSLGHCLNLATRQAINDEYREKLQEYNAKKKAGYRFLKKPNRPIDPFSKMYAV